MITTDTPATTPLARTDQVVPALPGVARSMLADSFEACRAITRSRARNFYYGLRLMPEPRRSAVYAIYAWMRAADDEADGDVVLNGSAAADSDPRTRLADFRATTQRVLDGDRGALSASPEGRFWPAFTATVLSYSLDPAIFFSMLDALEEDLDHPGYQTDDELAQYCYRVASTVGLACLGIWGLRPGADAAHASRLAELRGQAFQRTNILRDFAQDYDSQPRRIYLPRHAFEASGLTPADVRAWRDPARCREFMLEQAARARAQYDASAGLESMIDPACAPTLWAMTRIYSALLEAIERDPSRIAAGQRIRLGGPRKALIALRATWRSRRSGW